MRLGKFLSTDPLSGAFPYYSPYQFAGNTPIQAIDLDGGEPMGTHPNSSYGKLHGTNVKDIPSQYDGTPYEGSIGSYTGIITAFAVQDIASNNNRTFVIFEDVHKTRQWYWEYDKDGWKGNLASFSWYTPPNPADALTAMTVGPLVALPGMIAGGFAFGGGTMMDLGTKAYMTYWRWAPFLGMLGNQAAEFLDETGSAGLQNAATRKFAFGLRNIVEPWAEKIGAKHLMSELDWQMKFIDAITDPASQLHFNLNGIDDKLINMINDPMRSGINWELSTLYQNKEAFERTIFYYGEKTYTGSEVFNIKIDD